MNLLADEGVDRQIVERLRQEGHHVVYIAEVEPGITDEVVLDRANEINALLITLDKDFGELTSSRINFWRCCFGSPFRLDTRYKSQAGCIYSI